MNYKIALIALIVLVLIGTASALIVNLSKAQSSETDDSGIIKMIPMEIKNKEAGDEEIIFGDIFLHKQQLPALFHNIVYMAK